MADSARLARGPATIGTSTDDHTLVRRGVMIATGLVVVYVLAPSSWTALRGLVLVPLGGVFAVGSVAVGVARYRPVAPHAWLLVGAGLALFTLGFVAITPRGWGAPPGDAL